MSKLKDICFITSAKRIFEKEYVPKGIPFIRGQEISDKSLLKDNAIFECYISQKRFNEIKEKYNIPKKGDILITAVGTIGNTCYINKDIDFYFKDGNILQLTNFSKNVHPRYVYYYMNSIFFKKQLTVSMIGAVQKALTINMLSNVKIELPTLKKQIKISNILSSLDDKIELNNKINAELEAMAKTIYDYWFLQFEFPNEEGKPYKSSGGKMVWNEELKREIPEGWEVSKLNNYISVNRGVNYKKDDIIDFKKNDYVPLIKSNNIQNGQILFNDIIYVAKDLVNKNQILDKNSVLITMSSGSKGHMGKTVIIYNSMDYTFGAFCSKIKIADNMRCFLSIFFRSSLFKTLIDNITVGTNINNISNEHLYNIQIAVPNEKTLQQFENIINPVLDKQGIIQKENQELTSLRDFLLPLLINGQVGFKD